MSNIKLPHGKIPVAGIRDKAIREALMKLSENIVAIAKEIEKQIKRK